MTINGTVSTNPTKYQFKIEVTEDQVDLMANTSRVVAKAYARRISDYSSYDASETQRVTIDGNQSTGSAEVDLQTLNAWKLLKTHTRTITHNSDGSKSITVSASCDLGIGGGFGPTSGSASGTFVLTTIPREAYVSNMPNFTIGDDIPMTIVNSGNFWLEYELYVGATLIKTEQIGQATSFLIEPDSGEITNMYDETPNATSVDSTIRIKTYSDSGYSVQVGSDRDKSCLASVNQATNKPTFTTFTVSNLDSKVVANTDKYANVLVSTTLNATFLGSNNNIVKGFSKIRAVITTGNKATALNGASMVSYLMQNLTKQESGAYSGVATVNIDIDNVESISTLVRAIDSRNLYTDVYVSLSNMAEYIPVSAWGITVVRDNDVDEASTLSFSAKFWKTYFGGGSSGTLNTITAHYRYKETTVAWASQTWNSLTVTSDDLGNIEFSDYIDGDLGGSGFDIDKSYNIEVRLYDKLTNIIIEGVLDKGTPLIHYHKDGMAVKGKFDDGDDSVLQVFGEISRNGIPLADDLTGRLIGISILTASSGTFTTNAKTKKIVIELLGGGGGGAGATNAGSGEVVVGGAGGAGGYARKTFTVTPSTGYSYAVGALGTAGNNGSGGNGGNSTFTVGGTTVTAFGGSGSANTSSANTIGTRMGGAGGVISTNGDINMTGQHGEIGIRLSGSQALANRGGHSKYGTGGQGVTGNSNGNDAVGYGAGGSGSASVNAGGSKTGGAGVQGVIIVYEYS